MQFKKWTGSLLLVLMVFATGAQVTGGQYAFQFLTLSDAPHVSALGNVCVANTDEDIAFALQNPSLMRPAMHNELQLNYNSYYAGIGIMNLQYGYHVPEINTSFILGIQYINYGNFTQTDYSGNEYGTFQAREYAISLGASRSYGQHWRYGADIKIASSSLYTNTNAVGLLTDVGINYFDTSSLWDFGATAKNMGLMINAYTPAVGREPMPFDLQLGAAKQFAHIPLRIIITLHHFYEWDIAYNNPADVTNNALGGAQDTAAKAASFGDKLFRHFIFGAELTLAKKLTLTASYNVMRRQELKLTDMPASAGFAFGLGLDLNKIKVHYARSYYSIAGAYNEFSITMSLNKMMGIGKAGDKLHWNARYPDSMN